MTVFKIPINKDFFLYTMPAPKQADGLVHFFENLREIRINHVVNLLDNNDLRELGLLEEPSIARSLGLNYTSFPIEDFSFPHDTKAFIALAKSLKAEILNKQIIAIHCRAGIGRSSLLAAAILASFAFPKDKIFEHISLHRKVNVPDKEEQAIQLLKLYQELREL